MRTISRHRPADSPRGDVVRLCSYCGVAWYRSQMWRDASGNLVCPDEGDGRDIVTLNEGNAREMNARKLGKYQGVIDGSADSLSTDVDPGFVNPNGPPASKPNGGPTGPLSVITELWVRGDTLEADPVSGAVTKWTDQSSRNHDLLAAAAVNRPTVAVDAGIGQPAVTFDGVNHSLQATMQHRAPLWIWLVVKQVSWTPNSLVVSGAFGFSQDTVSPNLRIFRLTSVGAPESSNAPLGSWRLVTGTFNASDVDTLTVGSNSVSNASTGQRVSGAISVGSGPSGISKSNISVADLVVTDGPPTAAEQAGFAAYARARYGGVIFT